MSAFNAKISEIARSDEIKTEFTWFYKFHVCYTVYI